MDKVDKAFDKLLANWGKMDSDYIQKFKTYKSRFLNKSGRQKQKISYWKKVEMLKEAGFKLINVLNDGDSLEVECWL